MGHIYQQQKEFGKAAEAFNSAVEQSVKINSEDSLHRIQLFENLSAVYYNGSDLRKAVDCLKNALEIAEKYFNASDPEIARLYRNIGDVYLDYDDLIRALSSYHRAAATYYVADLMEDERYKDVMYLIKRCDALLNSIQNYRWIDNVDFTGKQSDFNQSNFHGASNSIKFWLNGGRLKSKLSIRLRIGFCCTII
ncbi:unnamed protein product [Rotaria sp. Silwood1]|nr:unnamed protein product [Rotaria sp. Silwood1]